MDVVDEIVRELREGLRFVLRRHHDRRRAVGARTCHSSESEVAVRLKSKDQARLMLLARCWVAGWGGPSGLGECTGILCGSRARRRWLFSEVATRKIRRGGVTTWLVMNVIDQRPSVPASDQRPMCESF